MRVRFDPVSTSPSESPDTPEVDLWRAVLAQAFRDAVLDFEGWNIRSAQKLIPARREARLWLTSGSKDFCDVCALAMLEPTIVLRSAVALKRRGWVHELKEAA
jgi:hypothetical protein